MWADRDMKCFGVYCSCYERAAVEHRDWINSPSRLCQDHSSLWGSNIDLCKIPSFYVRP